MCEILFFKEKFMEAPFFSGRTSGVTALIHLFFCQCLEMLLFHCLCNSSENKIKDMLHIFKCGLHVYLFSKAIQKQQQHRNNIGQCWELVELIWISESHLQSALFVSCITAISQISKHLIFKLISYILFIFT